MNIMKTKYLVLFLIPSFILLSSTVVSAGAVGGRKEARDTVSAFSTDRYTFVFRGEEVARIRVSGDGSTDFDCTILDNSGNLIESDTNPLDECNLVWSPRWTGKFTLKITNLGSSPNEYRLMTN